MRLYCNQNILSLQYFLYLLKSLFLYFQREKWNVAFFPYFKYNNNNNNKFIYFNGINPLLYEIQITVTQA